MCCAGSTEQMVAVQQVAARGLLTSSRRSQPHTFLATQHNLVRPAPSHISTDMPIITLYYLIYYQPNCPPALLALTGVVINPHPLSLPTGFSHTAVTSFLKYSAFPDGASSARCVCCMMSHLPNLLTSIAFYLAPFPYHFEYPHSSISCNFPL